MTRLERELEALERFYGLLPNPPRDPFALLVWEVLSAHTAPGRRDAAFAAMKRARILTPDAVARAPQATLVNAVTLAGAYLDQRLNAIQAAVRLFRRTPSLPSTIRGGLRDARRTLALLPQMDPAAPHRMLLFAADYPVLPVDTHVARVAVRLGHAVDRSSGRSASWVRRALMRQLPDVPDTIRRAHLYLSHHGRSTCTEAAPHCGVCPVRAECPEGMRRWWAAHGEDGPLSTRPRAEGD